MRPTIQRVVVLDPRSGDILLMIGSVDFGDREISGQINMALAPRQPGSAFKPFTYATLLEQGLQSGDALLRHSTYNPPVSPCGALRTGKLRPPLSRSGFAPLRVG